MPFGSVRLPQPDFSATSLQHALHAFGIQSGRAPETLMPQPVRSTDSSSAEAEFHRVLAGGVRQLVDERLDHERERVAAGRAQRTGADAAAAAPKRAARSWG